MNRTAALAYLETTYMELCTEADWSESAKLVAYSLAIDQALRSLGYDESDLQTADVPALEIQSYLALCDYFVLLRYSMAFATRADVSVSGAISASQSQVFKQVQTLLDAAEKRLAGLGLSTVEQVTAGRYLLDYLEPDIYAEGLG